VTAPPGVINEPVLVGLVHNEPDHGAPLVYPKLLVHLRPRQGRAAKALLLLFGREIGDELGVRGGRLAECLVHQGARRGSEECLCRQLLGLNLPENARRGKLANNMEPAPVASGLLEIGPAQKGG